MNRTYTYEFEYVSEKGSVLALPFDFLGGTFGSDYADAALSASDWLRETVLDYLLHEKRLPDASFNNNPKRGGTLGIVTVSVSLDSLKTVSANEAAKLLGVSKARVSQLVSEGLLEAYTVGRSVFVTQASIEARLADKPKAGRPKKACSSSPRAFKPTIVSKSRTPSRLDEESWGQRLEM